MNLSFKTLEGVFSMHPGATILFFVLQTFKHFYQNHGFHCDCPGLHLWFLCFYVMVALCQWVEGTVEHRFYVNTVGKVHAESLNNCTTHLSLCSDLMLLDQKRFISIQRLLLLHVVHAKLCMTQTCARVAPCSHTSTCLLVDNNCSGTSK